MRMEEEKKISITNVRFSQFESIEFTLKQIWHV